MVEGLIGKKIGMTQTFDEEGHAAPVTVIKAGPCTVIQKKTKEKDGYSALQLGFVEEKSKRKATKPLMGHYNKSGIPPVRILREFQFEEKGEVKEGDQFYVDIFKEGEKVNVIGTSKGKGFAGVMKRWGFHGGKASHGSMFHRAPGSVGASAFPSRVVKGKKLPGHMGDMRVTVKNLTVIQADKENNLLIVKGAVPGARGGYLLIKKANFFLESLKPEPSMPEKPKPEEPKVKPPKAEQPKAEEPKPEKPKEETLKPEQPKAEQLREEKAKPEQQEAEQPEPEPKQGEPEPSQPKQEQPKPEESEPHQSGSSKEKKKE